MVVLAEPLRVLSEMERGEFFSERGI